MKTLKLLNNFFLFLIINFYLIFTIETFSNEPENIWNIDENKIEDQANVEKKEIEEKNIDETSQKVNINVESLDQEILNFENKKLIGLYDPAQNNLDIEMWKNSDGDQIKAILKKLNSKKLSEDAQDILQIALLTNSYFPNINIKKDEFINSKINFLIMKDDLDLIENFIYKNRNLKNSQNLIMYYLDQNLINSKLDKSCSLLSLENFKNIAVNDYIEKFYIYCLISKNNTEDAKLYFDLKKETGFKDKFFESKFNFLIGYTDQNKIKLSEESVLDFHLSHLTDNNFSYIPNNNTKKFIWKYLSRNNLLEGINEVDLENEERISTIEIAVHEKNYSEKDLLNLYKRFQFSIDQLINAQNSYKLLPNYKGRALLYQRLLLTQNSETKLNLAKLIKTSMINDNIEDAFKKELSKILKNIEVENVPANFSNFYKKYVMENNVSQNEIKFNNKIIHQSKLLDYFAKGYSIDKANKETNDILKKVKANKKYIFSNKDKIMLDSLIYDGVDIQKKYANLYERNPNIPTDLQVYINNEDVGMILLRLVEIIGEDNLEDLGTETLYFITTVLNEINLDKLRNNILIKILPLKV